MQLTKNDQIINDHSIYHNKQPVDSIFRRRDQFKTKPSMKIIIPSITIVGFTFLVFGYGGNIAKIVRCQCKVHDPTALQNVRCWSKSLNRTYALANVRGDIVRVLDNISINFQVHRKAGVNYRLFLVNVTEDYCAFFAKNKGSKYFRLFGAIYLPYTNLNHTCPYFGEALIKDMPLRLNGLESTIPVGEYRVDAICSESNQKLVTLEFYAEILEYFRKRRF